MAPPDSLAPPLRQLVAEAWFFRWQVELDAALRFERMAGSLKSLGSAPAVVALAERAAEDERRHAAHCARLTRAYGGEGTAVPPTQVEEIAPSGLSFADQVLYEVVAACCVTETISVAVLAELNKEAASPEMKAVLHELLTDEVAHGKLGWAHLAEAASRRPVAFLTPLIPPMVAGSESETLFQPPPPERERAELLTHGVLPLSTKRRLFVDSLEQVIFPGLERWGVGSAPARAWLAERKGVGPT